MKANPELSMDRVMVVEDGLEISLPMPSPNQPDTSLNPKTTLTFIHTPGHTPGSQCILVNNCRLITGDTIFPGCCGRLDFPDSSPSLMRESLSKISLLDGNVVIYPGHSYGGSFTTIHRERQGGFLNLTNYDLQQRR